MQDNSQAAIARQYFLQEIARLNDVLCRNGISDKNKRQSICEKYFFDFCAALDDGCITLPDKTTSSVSLQFGRKGAQTFWQEIILQLVEAAFAGQKEQPAEQRNIAHTLPVQEPEQPALYLILTLRKYEPVYVSIFKGSDDSSIVSCIKQSLVAHLFRLNVVQDPRDPAVYTSMKEDIPLSEIHPSLSLSGPLLVQLSSSSELIEYSRVDEKQISIRMLLAIAKEFLR
jgi:hypothetical protein